MKIRNLAVAAVLITGLAGFIWRMPSSNQRLGKKVVRKIENFRMAQGGRLPESLTEVGITTKSQSDPPVSYRKESLDHYIVWYDVSLGESMVYDSATRKWDDQMY